MRKKLIEAFYIADIIGNYLETHKDSITDNTNNTLLVNNFQFTQIVPTYLATMSWLTKTRHSSNDMIKKLREYYRKYPDSKNCKYTRSLKDWLVRKCDWNLVNYEATGAIRASVIGYYAPEIKDAKKLVAKAIPCTNDSETALIAAEMMTIFVYLAKNNSTKRDIYKYLHDNYGYTKCKNLASYIDNYQDTNRAKINMELCLNCFFFTRSPIEAFRRIIDVGCNYNILLPLVAVMCEAFYKFIPKFLETYYRLNIPLSVLDEIINFRKYLSVNNRQCFKVRPYIIQF